MDHKHFWFYCREIIPHFATFHTTRPKLKDYYKFMNKCETDIVRVKINSTNEPISCTKNGTDIFTQILESHKFTQAVQSCRQGQIPWTLIPRDLLASTIQENLHLADYQFAIPLHEISKYYTLPLSDCLFIDDDVLLARVLIPTRFQAKDKMLNQYKMVRFEPIIFHRDGEFCWIDGLRDKRFVPDSVFPGNLHLTYCSDQEQKLCRVQVNHFSSQDASDRCPQALWVDDEDEILSSCKLNCIPSDKRHFQYQQYNFMDTPDDTFIYALQDDDVGVSVKCANGSQRFNMTGFKYGAWNVTLPCGCEIKGGKVIDFEISAPCHGNFFVEKIIPYHWKNGTNNENSGDQEVKQSLRCECPHNCYSERQNLILWGLSFLLCLTTCILSYFVVILMKWRRDELFKTNRLIYSNVVEGDGESIALAEQ